MLASREGGRGFFQYVSVYSLNCTATGAEPYSAPTRLQLEETNTCSSFLKIEFIGQEYCDKFVWWQMITGLTEVITL